MSDVLVDSNVILDVLTDDPAWSLWSTDALRLCAREGTLYINPIVYAEISLGFTTIEELEAAVPGDTFRRVGLPVEAAFLAGKAFVRYRQKGGSRTAALPDFFIGAHAAVAGMSLLTRDRARYRTYFPTVTLIAPGV